MANLNFPHHYGQHGEGRYREAVPFEGDAPDVTAGDQVQARDVNGKWHPKVAMDGPRYDHECSIGRTYLTVPVAIPEEWEAEGTEARAVNWPAEDVRKAGDPAPVTPVREDEGP